MGKYQTMDIRSDASEPECRRFVDFLSQIWIRDVNESYTDTLRRDLQLFHGARDPMVVRKAFGHHGRILQMTEGACYNLRFTHNVDTEVVEDLRGRLQQCAVAMSSAYDVCLSLLRQHQSQDARKQHALSAISVVQVFPEPEPPENHVLMLADWFLNKAFSYGLRKREGNIYTPVYVEYGDENRQFVYAYEQHCTMLEFMRAEVSPQCNHKQILSLLYKSGRNWFTPVSEHLSNILDHRLPELEVDYLQISFRNGVYHLMKRQFYPYAKELSMNVGIYTTDEKGVHHGHHVSELAGRCSMNYIDQEFPYMTIATYLYLEDPATGRITHTPMDIPTPKIDSILLTQQFAGPTCPEDDNDYQDNDYQGEFCELFDEHGTAHYVPASYPIVEDGDQPHVKLVDEHGNVYLVDPEAEPVLDDGPHVLKLFDANRRPLCFAPTVPTVDDESLPCRKLYNENKEPFLIPDGVEDIVPYYTLVGKDGRTRHVPYHVYERYEQNAVNERMIMSWIYAFNIRPLYPLKVLDNWEMAKFDLGAAGAGKSLMAQLTLVMVPPHLVGIINNVGRENFQLHNIYKKMFAICFDLDDKFNLDENRLKTMISGEKTDVEIFYKESISIVWTAVIWLIGNSYMKLKNAGGSMTRRLFVVNYERVPKHANPQLFNECLEELPLYIVKANEMYHYFAHKYRKYKLYDPYTEQAVDSEGEPVVDEHGDPVMVTRKSVLPDYFRKTRDRLIAQTDPVYGFIINRCKFGPDLSLSYARMVDEYKSYMAELKINDVRIPKKTLNRIVEEYDLRREMTKDQGEVYHGIGVQNPFDDE